MSTTAILAATILLSLFLALVLLSGPDSGHSGAKFLGLCMLVLGLFLFSFAWQNGNLGLKLNLMISVFFISILLVMQPLTFMYVLRVTGVKSLTNRNHLHFVHFLPSVLSLIIFVIFLFFLPEEAISEIKARPINKPYPGVFPQEFKIFLLVFKDLLVFLQIPVYAVLLIVILRKHYTRIRDYYSNLEGFTLSWFQWFVFMYFIFLGSILVAEYLVSASVMVINLIYAIEVLVFLVFIGYFGLRQQDVVLLPQEPKPSYFDDSKASAMEELLKKVLEDEKPFLDTHFTINALAILMKTNRMYVSVLLNDYVGQSFYSLINSYRIDEAVRILDGTESMKYSIEGIAHSVGFKSKSTFIKHFRVKTGLTPGEYRIQQQNEAS